MPSLKIVFGAAVLVCLTCGMAAGEKPVRFEQEKGALRVYAGDTLFGRYVFEDTVIKRPYWCDLHTPGGVQITRNHPPVKGRDSDDHADMHPGLWLAFGDISGADFWRNKGAVHQLRFVKEPSSTGATGSFTVENASVAPDGKEVCRQVVRYEVQPRENEALLLIDAVFQSDKADFYFGDQEEMGLGLRVTTPITVKNGGTILNSEGARNEAGVWGKPSLWAAYEGKVEGQTVGVCLMPYSKNFRPSWFHARDYGLLVANAFGNKAFTNGEESKVVVRKGDTFRLRYGVLIYQGTAPDRSAATAAYEAVAKTEESGQ